MSARIARSLSAERQQSELERIIEALIFSFLTYVVYLLLFGVSFPIEWLPTLQVHRWRVAFLVVIAVGLGAGWGFLRSKDRSLGPFRMGRLTQRNKDESVWNDIFASMGGTVQIGLHDGRRVIGWLRAYSDSGGERSVFLEKASWINEEDESLVEIPGKGILLSDKAEIEYVMFLDQ